MARQIKGNKVEISTFLNWKKQEIGYNVEEIGGKSYVVKIWCKVCARHGEKIRYGPEFRGSVQSSVDAFITGTTSVTKFQVDRHLAGPFHKKAVAEEDQLPASVCFSYT